MSSQDELLIRYFSSLGYDEEEIRYFAENDPSLWERFKRWAGVGKHADITYSDRYSKPQNFDHIPGYSGYNTDALEEALYNTKSNVTSNHPAVIGERHPAVIPTTTSQTPEAKAGKFAEHMKKHWGKYAIGAGILGAGGIAYGIHKSNKRKREKINN